MSKAEKPGKASPGPWRWVDESDEAMRARGMVGTLVDANDKGVPFDWLKPLVLKLPEMAAMLRELEWMDHDDGPGNVCYFCCRGKSQGHAPDCRLAALLAELGRG